MDWIAKVKQTEEHTPATVNQMEREYITLLRHFWAIDDTGPIEECQRLLAKLDELYRELQRQGRRVPVRLPIERHHREHVQGEMAL